MTASAIDPADLRIAHYAALAIVLSVIEGLLPSPIPGVKPGFANIVVLIVLVRHGWREAAWVAMLRVLGASLALGSFLTIGFWLSFAGASCSIVALAVARFLPSRWFGPVSLSILAAYAHIAGQLALARAVLIPHDGLYTLLPVFMGAALVFGCTNGLIAGQLLKRDPA
ncbi:Gx transporter family protein [Chitinibacteraceae bacterium HSL-7]